MDELIYPAHLIQMQIMSWKCPLFIASSQTVSLFLSLTSEVQQRSAALPKALLDTRHV